MGVWTVRGSQGEAEKHKTVQHAAAEGLQAGALVARGEWEAARPAGFLYETKGRETLCVVGLSS